MWESLRRGGDHWYNEAVLLEEEGDTIVVLRLLLPLPTDAKKSISEYAKEYLLATGHKVKRIRFTKSYVEVRVSRD